MHTTAKKTWDSKTLSGPAWRTFLRLAEKWSLSTEEQMVLLGLGARSTFFHWKKIKEPRLPKDTLERISYLLGIYKALQILLPDQDAADGWLRKPNHARLFQGRPALDTMLSGNVVDLHTVRQYLDAQRGGWS